MFVVEDMCRDSSFVDANELGQKNYQNRIFVPMGLGEPQSQATQHLFYLLKPIFVQNVYADFLDLTRVRVQLNLPVHFRHLLPSDDREYEEVYEEPAPRFYFNCFESDRLDHSLPLDLRTELVMRIGGADIIRLDLARNITESPSASSRF